MISFDHKMLGISSGKPDGTPGSFVYVLPLSGGEPRQITQEYAFLPARLGS